VRTSVERANPAAASDTASAVRTSTAIGITRAPSPASLTSRAWIFLPNTPAFADHESTDEDREDRVEKQGVQTGTRATRCDFAIIMPVSSPKPPMGVKSRRTRRPIPSRSAWRRPEECGRVSPKRTSLPSVLPTVEWIPAAATAGCSGARQPT